VGVGHAKEAREHLGLGWMVGGGGASYKIADLKQRALNASTQSERIVRLETRLESIAESLNGIAAVAAEPVIEVSRHPF
jgi:hypothetical protein